MGVILDALDGTLMDLLVSTETDKSTLLWLMNALERTRTQDRTKLAGYLEAVLEDVIFEVESASRADGASR